MCIIWSPAATLQVEHRLATEVSAWSKRSEQRRGRLPGSGLNIWVPIPISGNRCEIFRMVFSRAYSTFIPSSCPWASESIPPEIFFTLNPFCDRIRVARVVCRPIVHNYLLLPPPPDLPWPDRGDDPLDWFDDGFAEEDLFLEDPSEGWAEGELPFDWLFDGWVEADFPFDCPVDGVTAGCLEPPLPL